VALKNESIGVIRAFAPQALLGPDFPKTRKGTVAHLAASAMAVARSVPTSPAPPASGAASTAGMTSRGHIHQAPTAMTGSTVTASRETNRMSRRWRYRVAIAAGLSTWWSVSFVTG
jgi:hypothetical protein